MLNNDLVERNIAVIVPVYNVKNYLKRCIDSLLIQTYQRLEIVIVDDGSTDGSSEICDDYGKKYDNIVVLHKENGGLSDARNYGVMRTKCEWIVFVDSDDYVDADYISVLWKLRCKYESDMSSICIQRQYLGEPDFEKKNRFSSRCVTDLEALIGMYSGKLGTVMAPGKLIRRSRLVNSPFPNAINEDTRSCYWLTRGLCKVAMGDYRYLYHYIYREKSLVSAGDKDKIHDLIKSCIKMGKDAEVYFGENNNILPVMICQQAMLTSLNMQNLAWCDFREIFTTYRPFFQKNFFSVIKSKQLTLKTKMYTFLLVGVPQGLFFLGKLKKHR